MRFGRRKMNGEPWLNTTNRKKKSVKEKERKKKVYYRELILIREQLLPSIFHGFQDKRALNAQILFSLQFI
ncbi:MAG: hypothetical protein EZS28_027776 [Streblomastix strix]|uniref:Uncharacterized protein n=1 Tax=Streblomastix strix TaxID=222440 RepID=A0A5J4V2T0_9EUKA|nr:MAG: hypothetical protein EZS28_027776 [Streblomastix strix]